MAINTYKTFLMYGTNTTATSLVKLVDIKTKPRIIGTKEGLDATTLSDPIQIFIDGIITVDQAGFEFEANWDKTTFTSLKALESAEHKFGVYYGGTESNGVATPTGSDGKFEFCGYLTASDAEASVNAVQNMIINIRPTTGISFSAS